MTCATLISSPTRANSAAQQSGSVKTEVSQPLVSAEQEIKGQWQQTWPEDATGWLISNDIKLAANKSRVVEWEISFDVPERTRVNPAQTQWYVVKKDGSDGTVVLASPETASTPSSPVPVSPSMCRSSTPPSMRQATAS